jgi:hypothetical protein
MADILALPTDPVVLQTVGQIAIAHSQLDYVMRLTIKTVTGKRLHESRHETRRKPSMVLREKVRKVVEAKLGPCAELEKLILFLDRVRQVTERRNRVIHDICYMSRDGTLLLKDDNTPAVTYPSNRELKNLLHDIRELASELNVARTRGYLSTALIKYDAAHETAGAKAGR